MYLYAREAPQLLFVDRERERFEKPWKEYVELCARNRPLSARLFGDFWLCEKQTPAMCIIEVVSIIFFFVSFSSAIVGRKAAERRYIYIYVVDGRTMIAGSGLLGRSTRSLFFSVISMDMFNQWLFEGFSMSIGGENVWNQGINCGKSGFKGIGGWLWEMIYIYTILYRDSSYYYFFYVESILIVFRIDQN